MKHNRSNTITSVVVSVSYNSDEVIMSTIVLCGECIYSVYVYVRESLFAGVWLVTHSWCQRESAVQVTYADLCKYTALLSSCLAMPVQ